VCVCVCMYIYIHLSRVNPNPQQVRELRARKQPSVPSTMAEKDIQMNIYIYICIYRYLYLYIYASISGHPVLSTGARAAGKEAAVGALDDGRGGGLQPVDEGDSGEPCAALWVQPVRRLRRLLSRRIHQGYLRDLALRVSRATEARRGSDPLPQVPPHTSDLTRV